MLDGLIVNGALVNECDRGGDPRGMGRGMCGHHVGEKFLREFTQLTGLRVFVHGGQHSLLGVARKNPPVLPTCLLADHPNCRKCNTAVMSPLVVFTAR